MEISPLPACFGCFLGVIMLAKLDIPVAGMDLPDETWFIYLGLSLT